LRGEIAARLRRAILAGELQPGTHLREQHVADSMSVSRVPAREALRALEQEGLIEIFPFRGAVVVGVSEEELDAIYELRAVIEGKAMRQVVETPGAELLEELARQIEEMESSVRSGADVERLAELDIQFHRTILEASGLRILARVRNTLDAILRVRSFYQGIERGGATGAYFRASLGASHERLLEALRSGDAERAEGAAREHVMEVVDRLGTASRAVNVSRPGRR
jgi:DNA-binding GntR family transcriptional regulator